MMNLKYRHPIIYWTILIGIFLSCSLLIATMIKIPNELYSNVKNAAYYSVKAYLLDGRDAEWVSPQKHFVAEVKGFTKSGLVLLKNGRGDIVEAELADLVIIDKIGVAKEINALMSRQIYVDFYQYKKNKTLHNCVVLWDEKGEPINLTMLNKGIVRPLSTPPTNIVHKLFAQYYVNKLIN